MNNPLSKTENKRFRIDSMETDIERAIDVIEENRHHDSQLIKIYIDYLKWCISVLKSQNDQTFIQQKYNIENKLIIYKKRISELETYNGYYNNSKFTKEPIIGYGDFLQAGLRLYIENIDAYKIILNINEAFYLAYSKTPNIASYSFITLLARYTLPKNSLLYNQIYHTTISKVKQALPHVYANPSYENVLGLLFLTFISLSHFNTKASTRYFSLAVRMAQSLRYDKMAEEQNELLYMDEKEKESIKKGKQMWVSISTIYFLLATLIPNIPIFRIKLNPSVNLLSSTNSPNANSKPSSGTCCCRSPKNLGNVPDKSLENKNSALQAKLEVISYIQNVKLEKFNKIPIGSILNNELRLPLDKFNQIASSLLNETAVKMKSPNNQSGQITEYSFNNLANYLNYSKENFFIYQTNANRQFAIILLYYPSVMSFPKAVKFPFNEAIVLFNAAQFITEYYINVDKVKMNNPHLLPDTSISCMGHNDGFGRTYYSSYYIKLMYALYVYLCLVCEFKWLLSQGISNSMIAYSQEQALLIINFLKVVSLSYIPNERKDALEILGCIKTTASNFNIPEPFSHVFMSILP